MRSHPRVAGQKGRGHRATQAARGEQEDWSWMGFFGRQRDDLVRDAMIALVAAVIAICAALWIDARQDGRESQRAEREATIANVAFVRERAIAPRDSRGDDPMPFQGMILVEARLGGLDLTKGDFSRGDLRSADLSGATMTEAKFSRSVATGAVLANASLKGANFVSAHLEGADLGLSDLTDASFTFAQMTGAALHGVQLVGTDLRGADLSQVTGLDDQRTKLEGVCWDAHTIWPENFDPPPPSDRCRPGIRYAKGQSVGEPILPPLPTPERTILPFGSKVDTIAP